MLSRVRKRLWPHLGLLLAVVMTAVALFALFVEDPFGSPQSRGPASGQEHTGPGQPWLRPGVSGDAAPLLRGGRREAPAPRLPAELCMVGRIVSDADSLPIEGAHVFLDPGDWASVEADEIVRSDADGVFLLPAPRPAGPQDVKVTARGFTPWRGMLAASERSADGTIEESVIRLQRGAAISGRVVGSSGDPVPGAAVWCARSTFRLERSRDDGSLPGGAADGDRTTTNEQGAFRLTGLVAEQVYEVFATKRGFRRTGGFSPPRVDAGTREVLLVLDESCRVQVSVAGADGRDLTDWADVSLSASSGWRWAGGSTYEGILQDREGSDVAAMQHRVYLFARTSSPTPSVEPLRLTVRAHMPGYAPASTTTEVLPGASAHVRLVLQASAASAERFPVHLTANFADRAAVSGGFSARVRPVGGRWQAFFVQFVDGEASRLMDLPAGAHEVRLGPGLDRLCDGWHPLAEPWRFDVFPTDSPIVVPLVVQGNPLSLVVESPEGVAVRGYDLRVAAAPMGARPGIWHYAWDWDPSRDRSDGTADSPILFVGKGTSRIQISMPSVGGATAILDAPGDGSPLQLTIRLIPAQEVRFREIMERHRKMSAPR